MMRLISLKKVVSLLLLAILIAVGFPAQKASAQSMDSTADIKVLAGDLEFSQVPSINFNIDIDKPVFLGTREDGVGLFEHQAVGEISGNFVIEDARTTGKNWNLKVSLSDFTNIEKPKQKINDVYLKIEAPQNASSGTTGQEFQGYPVTMKAGSNEYHTIATSNSATNKISIWEGSLPKTEILFPYRSVLAKSGDVYKADMLWSIEDAP